MKTINEYLNGNTYPGRGVLIGKSADNAHYVAAYFIMGRSENSRNRIFEPTEDGIRTRAFDEKKLFETYRIVILPGGCLEAQPHLPGTEEYITLFRGAVEISVCGEWYALRAGDSMRFRADAPHAYRNLAEQEAELSMLIYYNA